ncbi:MAG: hypothetical protein ABIQ88_07775 [Chitinophagaceae bacterium]
MNIQNISALASQLKTIGFENMGYSLLKRICLLPVNFIISEKISKESGQLIFNLYFQKDKNNNGYRLEYYDAVLQNELSFIDMQFEGVSIAVIEKNMKIIDWKTAFDFNTKKSFNSDDKSNYEKEQMIEQVMIDLSKLEMTEEGKQVSLSLKQKYWGDIPYNDLMGNLSAVKNKSELSQRFYCAEERPLISADEAYRFLQNKWLEKQLQLKRKQQDSTDESEPKDNSRASSGSSLLKKRRTGGAQKSKRIRN